jgi:hypothetical protein
MHPKLHSQVLQQRITPLPKRKEIPDFLLQFIKGPIPAYVDVKLSRAARSLRSAFRAGVSIRLKSMVRLVIFEVLMYLVQSVGRSSSSVEAKTRPR